MRVLTRTDVLPDILGRYKHTFSHIFITYSTRMYTQTHAQHANSTEIHTMNEEVIGAQHKREIDLSKQICHFFINIIP